MISKTGLMGGWSNTNSQSLWRFKTLVLNWHNDSSNWSEPWWTEGGSFAVVWCLHSMTSKHLRPRCRKRWLFGYFSSWKKCLRLGETECRLMLLWASKVTSLFVYFFAIKKVRRLVMLCAEIQATKEVIFKRKPPLEPPGRAHNHVCRRRTWCLVRVIIEVVQTLILRCNFDRRHRFWRDFSIYPTN